MNRISSLTFAAILLMGLPAVGQQPATSTLPITDSSGVPTVEAQMKLFTARLDLSDDQQSKLVPILQDLHDTTVQAVHDAGRPVEERLEQVHSARLAADRKIRVILNDEQRAKLDQIEREPHLELHGTVDQTIRAQP